MTKPNKPASGGMNESASVTTIGAELTRPVLEAFHSYLDKNQHSHPPAARPFAYNMIGQIEAELAGEFGDGFQKLFGAQLARFETACKRAVQ